MRIQVISKDNGVGLSHDYQVLRTAILLAHPDAEVFFLDWQNRQGGRKADVNIYLELLPRDFIGLAPRNIYVPNPEWYFSDMWGAALPRVTEVWAKTNDCQAIFKALHRKVVYSGWTSEFAMNDTVEREKRVLHVAGASSAKGTTAVIDALGGIPEVRLTLITKVKRLGIPMWVDQVVAPSDEEREHIQRSHILHLCPSSYEGFGHYINEARACGAVVITTNAAPMNELITKETGFGAPVASTSRQSLATHQHVDPVALRHLVVSALGAPIETLRAIGDRARAAYLADRALFHEFIKEQLK